jgi:gliding motility-associated-like protein
MIAGAYTYTVNGLAPCPAESATVTVAINTPPDPGTDGTITLCSSDPAVSLFAQLGGTPDAGGAWIGPSAVVGDSFDPATMAAGAYTYTVSSVAPCPALTSEVLVIINPMPDAGIAGGLTLCSSSPTTNLVDGLNGSPDAGGIWTAPDGGPSNGTFTPGSGIAGSYTYTVNGSSPCPSVAAQVVVTVVTNPDAGTPGSATLCATDAALLLFTELGGTPDAGGTWSGPSAVIGGLYDPATMNPGAYTYTITVPPPCVNASSTVTITEVAPPNAGNDGAITLCISSPATSLFAALGGAAQAGGSWSGPSTVTTGQFDPATMDAGVYTYTVSGTAPCPNDAATVTVTVVSAPDAGTPGTATLCNTDTSIDLFTELGGTPDLGGTWSGPSAVIGGLYDPATMDPGVYTYTITVPPPCVNASSTVTITEVAPPNAGNDGAITLCISSPAISLFAALGGAAQAGGSWSGPSTVTTGQFDPATMDAGVYTYTVNGTAPCPNDAATVTVTVVSAPDAGTPGTATLCSTDTSIDLLTELGGTPDLGGTWSGPSAVIGGLYDPATMDPGVYTYTITVPPPCVNASSTVTITEVAPPNAGNDGAITLCISSPATSLFAALGGAAQAGGSWSGPSTVTAGQFDPATMDAGVYTYTVNGTAPCPNDAATVTVTVVSAPDAGTPGTATLCSTDTSIDLFTELGGTPDLGGTWSGPSAVIGGLYDPATMDPGVYSYTITVPAPCVNVSSTVEVTTVQAPDAGVDGALTLCITGATAPLVDGLGGSPDVGGAWSGPSTVTNGQFLPATMLAGTYNYTVAGQAPCPADIASVMVSVSSEPDPGGPGFLSICASDETTDLFERLEGSPDAGGVWAMPDGAVFSGLLDPASMPSGVYTYSITVPPPCMSVSSTVTVEVVLPPDAGEDGTLTLCATGGPEALFGSLGGNPDPNGSWSTGTGAPWTGIFDPNTDSPGDLVYTVNGTSPCPQDIAVVSVSVIAPPVPGTDDIVNLCITGSPVDLFPALGTADPAGVWTTSTGAAFTGVFTPSMDQAGDFTYSVAGTAPCPAASAVITVNVITDADAGADGANTLCVSNPPSPLFNLLGGTPDAGGDWFDPFGNAVNGTFDPASQIAGIYTYVVAVPAPCLNDTSVVTIAITQEVNAGLDGSVTLCSDDGSIELFDGLGGAPDLGGTWSGPGGSSSGLFTPASDLPGTYQYTVTASAPCPNAVAMVEVTVHPLPDAGADGSLSVCPGSSVIDLFSLLGGSPDTGGAWIGPTGLSGTGTFTPSEDIPGTYTYIVAGTAPCPDASASATVTIHVVPQPDAGPDAFTCTLGTSMTAEGDWVSGTWSGPSGISFGDVSSGSTSVAALQGGTYTLTWSTLSAEGCTAMDTVSITFTDDIIPVVSATDAVCNGSCDGSASVLATGGNTIAGAYDYVWSDAAAGNVAQATGLCAGTYSVTVLDANGCNATATFTIGEPEPLVIDAIFDVDETCPGTCDGQVVVQDPEGALYSIDGGENVQAANSFNGLCPGEYAVMMQDASGCTSYGVALIGSPMPVEAAFLINPDTLFIDEPTADLINTSSSNATTFLWDFGTGDTSTETSPSYSFPGGLGATYTVCLTAMDANGCTDSVCAPIQVFDLLLVHVANAFTPNGDGFNDGFAPVFNQPWVSDYEFLIFDRWGERIFESRTVDEQWTGRYGSDVVETEVYVWKLTCKDQLTGELIERIGHVSVLK